MKCVLLGERSQSEKATHECQRRDILEQTKLDGSKSTDFPGTAGGGGRHEWVEHGGFLGQRSYSVML